MPKIHHLPHRLQADATRVVIRPFQLPSASGRMQRIFNAVSAMDMRTCQAELAIVGRDFESRHWQTRQIFLKRYEQVSAELGIKNGLSDQQRQLVGAYFCHEYSYSAAALMNPSVVPHVDQSGLTPGSVRFIMSLRAVGEGHISSIAFREGILTHDGRMDLMPEPPFATAVQWDKPCGPEVEACPVTAERHPEASLSGTVIFPFTPAQAGGLEDMRLVRFLDDDDKTARYLGTYTAYSGRAIGSELMSTDDFRTFRMEPMRGPASRNKGMALFPRKVDGQYMMIGRQDGENIFLLKSDDLLEWGEGELLMKPRDPWELVQIGNCGSPIELDEGWLLLTHGVGAMRKYAIGAVLLDKQDPSKIIGRLPGPLLSPADEDREGYVPNVVYTCGAIANHGRLFMPYGVADSSVGFALVELDELLGEMV